MDVSFVFHSNSLFPRDERHSFLDGLLLALTLTGPCRAGDDLNLFMVVDSV